MRQAEPEVVVIGAGPAGAGAALRLSTAGASVVLVERQRLPRSKVCGGCLHRRGVKRLKAWGVDADVLRAVGAESLVKGELVAGGRTLRWPRGHGMSVDRGAFDAALVTAASRAGATVLAGTAARVERTTPAWWRVRLSDGSLLSPRWVLVADGLGGSSLRDIEGFAVTRSAASYVGAGVVLRDGPRLENGLVRMFVGRGGYVGAVNANRLPSVSSEHGGTVAGGVAGGGLELAAALSPALLKQHRGTAAAVAGILREAGAEPSWVDAVGRVGGRDDQTAAGGGWRLTPALTSHRLRVASPGLLVVGDAAGYVEPFTGEGMAWALAAADASSVSVASALSGSVSHCEVARRWSRTCSRQRWGRWWCKGTRSALRQPGLLMVLTRSAAWMHGTSGVDHPPAQGDQRVAGDLCGDISKHQARDGVRV